MNSSLSMGREAMMMRDASDIERSAALSGFVLSCVLAERKDRFLSFVQSKRGLTKWLGQLDHFQNYLDIERAIRVDIYADAEELIQKLKLKTQLPVFAFSTLSEYRVGCVLSLQSALGDVFLIGNGAIICSADQKNLFWFYLGEERSQQYFFRNN